ncbi:tau 95 subunit of transcription factor TFIIIC [Trapelia coarctata]|nr:tau 95 subunit of transcription factor TFIIIC [Trapelia coarctata]
MISEPALDDPSNGARAMPSVPTPRAAPWYLVPSRTIVSVEHPFIVKDVSKAVESLGGPKAVGKLVQTGSENSEATLYLKPRDRLSKSIPSGSVRTQNVLLEVTVPKRTGRKRKRRSAEPYRYEDDLHHVVPSGQGSLGETHSQGTTSTSLPAKRLLRSLRDNDQDYSLQPMGIIYQTHRFRAMPDFVYSTANTTFMQKMRDYILPFDYETSKAFAFDMSRGPTGNTELIPPPMFTHLSLPFNYAYQQNASMKQFVDSLGNATTINTANVLKTHTPRIPFDTATVPTAPSREVPPIDSLDPALRRLVTKLEELLLERPIWTRRAITNQIYEPGFDNIGKQLFQYVAYMFVSGPWRDALVKYGVDPRTDPKYRIHQTMVFQFETEAKEKIKQSRGGFKERKKPADLDRRSHIFDGINVSVEGRVYQVCDILDPMVQKMLATPDIRERCHIEADGWYHNGTLAKAKVITKAKMVYIREGKGTPRDEIYAVIAQLPDIITKETRELAVLSKAQNTAQEVQWASIVRGMAKFEIDGDDEEGGREGEEEVGKLKDPPVKLSMKEYEDMQQAGEDVEDQDIMADDDPEEEGSDSSGEENDGEEEADEDEDEQDEEGVGEQAEEEDVDEQAEDEDMEEPYEEEDA